MVKGALYVPDRRDLVRLTFDPQAGHEQAGRRPALVVTPEAYNRKVGLAIVCPVTGQEKGYPFEVRIPLGLRCSGVILSDHVKNVDWRARNAEFVDKLPEPAFQNVVQKLRTLIC